MSEAVPSARASLRLWLWALLVFGAMLPATIVIPVVRSFVASVWPGSEWAMHAFLAVNLFGAVVGGPILAVRAERLARRRVVAGVSAALDGALLLAVALGPPLAVMLALRLVQGAVYIAAVSILMGTIRRQAKSGSAMGVVGGAVVSSILVGIPLGAVLGKASPMLPLYAGGAIGVLTGLATLWLLPADTDAETSKVTFRELLSNARLRAPAIVVGLERFAVGAFLVPLQLYGHHVLGVKDHQVSTWFSAFLMTFALATWPFARLGDRFDRWRIVAIGAATYALSYLALAVAPVGAIILVMTIAGLASAAIYGPSLGLAAQAAPDSARASAMAVLNASGTMGMFLGSTAGGLLSSALIASGLERATAYPIVFAIAGVAQFISVVVALTAGVRTQPVS